MCTGRRPATTSTENEHTRITSVVPRSCCRNTSAITNPASAIADREAPGVEIVAMVMAVAGDRDHHHDLGDLRRLELQRARPGTTPARPCGASRPRAHRPAAGAPRCTRAPTRRGSGGSRSRARRPSPRRRARSRGSGARRSRAAQALPREPRLRRRVDHQQPERRRSRTAARAATDRRGATGSARLDSATDPVVSPSVVALVDGHDGRRAADRSSTR